MISVVGVVTVSPAAIECYRRGALDLQVPHIVTEAIAKVEPRWLPGDLDGEAVPFGAEGFDVAFCAHDFSPCLR